MAQIRGTALRGTLRFVNRADYPGGAPALLRQLSPPLQQVFYQRISSSGWYPYEAYHELLMAVDQLIGQGDLSLMRHLGHFNASQDAESILEVVTSLGGLEAVVPRGGFFWRRLCDTGDIAVASPAERRVRIAITGFPDISPAHCRLIPGWLEALGWAMGEPTTSVQTSACVHHGDPVCEFVGRW